VFCGLALAIANGGASLHRTINPAYKAAGLITTKPCENIMTCYHEYSNR
jgi:hypothetical protein